MSKIDKVLYTGKTRTTGGREGSAKSDDGRLDITLSPPGSHGKGTNPEQLFAAGWSACCQSWSACSSTMRDWPGSPCSSSVWPWFVSSSA